MTDLDWTDTLDALDSWLDNVQRGGDPAPLPDLPASPPPADLQPRLARILQRTGTLTSRIASSRKAVSEELASVAQRRVALHAYTQHGAGETAAGRHVSQESLRR